MAKWSENRAFDEIFHLSQNMDRPRIRVDFNALAAPDLVLLSKEDLVLDSAGNQVLLVEGAEVFVYEYNHYEDGEREYLLADGIAEINRPEINGEWTRPAKWCCRMDARGVRVETRRDT